MAQVAEMVAEHAALRKQACEKIYEREKPLRDRIARLEARVKEAEEAEEAAAENADAYPCGGRWRRRVVNLRRTGPADRRKP